ncbi:hypothetical protein BV394_03120 [Brevirhabdus pacifica]|uniref:Uncharacterized protein n=1 Tax=Brevirhabdus pacifica TaxID=1267768 RepID=A0A1U7DFR8_9RHOB|nr:hypothetical protein [Brevirhabdus pacifica]APX88844.1 hypothetical protein BV394_03120 [Brevirhabdus pacifica]OWU80082.1 hypothetical protein ATO5_03805 [Loktanella sp. 22II-4b]PJJ86618.1 hypothetical protein CLV77_1170 [Brevirhabdus pacifica]
MEILVWIGAALSVIGLCGLLYCIVLAARARTSGAPHAEIQQRMQKVVALNLAALSLSGLGLGMVIVGVLLS